MFDVIGFMALNFFSDPTVLSIADCYCNLNYCSRSKISSHKIHFAVISEKFDPFRHQSHPRKIPSTKYRFGVEKLVLFYFFSFNSVLYFFIDTIKQNIIQKLRPWSKLPGVAKILTVLDQQYKFPYNNNY